MTLGELAKFLDEDSFEDIFDHVVELEGSWRDIHGRAVLFSSVLQNCYSRLDEDQVEECLSVLEELIASQDHVSIVPVSIQCCFNFLNGLAQEFDEKNAKSLLKLIRDTLMPELKEPEFLVE